MHDGLPQLLVLQLSQYRVAHDQSSSYVFYYDELYIKAGGKFFRQLLSTD